MIGTPRLSLRPWREADRAPFAAMGRDREVMAWLGPLLDTQQSNALVDQMLQAQAEQGCCFWALERRLDGAFLGFCGIKRGSVGPIAGRPEIGWRLARHAWGQGYAREAAQASLAWAWAQRDWPAVYAITTPGNRRSWGLMLRLGMEPLAGGEFPDPGVPADDPTSPTITFVVHRPVER